MKASKQDPRLGGEAKKSEFRTDPSNKDLEVGGG